MPSRGPDGKPLSGAALRKRKQQQDAAARAREAKRKKLASRPAPAAASPTSPAATGLDFAALPAPPLGDPMSAMGWWNDVLLVCADQVLRDPALGLERRVKFLADFSAKAGMIRDKSAESKAIRDALRQKAKAAEDAGLERAGSPPPQVPRPAG